VAVRVAIDEDNTAWYRAEGLPEFEVRTISHEGDDPWIVTAIDEGRTSFDVASGPLVRFALVKSPQRSELVVCSHHAICDGKSMTYLIRDNLQYLVEPDQKVEVLPVPPPITADTVESPPRLKISVVAFLNLLPTGHTACFPFCDLFMIRDCFLSARRDVSFFLPISSI